MYWFAAQQQTSTLRRQKFHCFYVKFKVQSNEFDFFFKEQQEVAKTKVVQQNTKWRLSEAKR